MSLTEGFRSRRRTLAAGLALFGTMAVCMGAGRHFGLYLIFMILYGAALTAVQTVLTTMLQEKAETNVQGQVLGLMSSLYSGCYPLGMVLFGTMADRIPLQGIMIFSGAALLLTAAAVIRNPHLQ